MWEVDSRKSKKWILKDGKWLATALDRPSAEAICDAHNVDIASIAAERDNILAAIEDVLSPGKLHKDYSGSVACQRCGWFGCYSKVGGCEPIADTGDYGEPLCPECNAYIGVEEELLREVYAAIKGRILARIEGRPWPAFPCCFCEKEVTKETGYFTTNYVACKPCDDKHWDDMADALGVESNG